VTEPLNSSGPGQVEAFLSRTYQRIQRNTLILAAAGAIAATLLRGWRSGLALACGSLIAFINLVWLHQGATMMIERFMPSAGKLRSKSRLVLSFTGRYLFLIVSAYVILKSFPGILLPFTVGLFLPILAAMCEGMYEVFVRMKYVKSQNKTSLL